MPQWVSSPFWGGFWQLLLGPWGLESTGDGMPLTALDQGHGDQPRREANRKLGWGVGIWQDVWAVAVHVIQTFLAMLGLGLSSCCPLCGFSRRCIEDCSSYPQLHIPSQPLHLSYLSNR